MSNDELFNILKSKKIIINNILDTLVPITKEPMSIIQEAMRYSLLSEGKRIRPTLCLLTAEMFTKENESFFKIASALELLHVYTLIHDDLPCMDNDDLRRGKPTLHKVFPESIALLAGDALLTKCFEIISESSISFPDIGISIIKDLALLTGENGVIGGQVLDILSENKNISQNELFVIHHNKTAKLIMASVRIGGMLGKANNKEMNHLTSYAECIGHAFQISDDILDEIGDEKKLGKKTGQDIKLNKATYPKFFGIQKSKEILHEKIQTAITSLQIFGEKANPLKLIAEYIGKREN